MAGAGYKQFADGDVLTAEQVQTYLQDQAVMKFADSSARTTGLGTAVAEGMLSYLADTDAVEVYDGSAWAQVGADPNPGIGTNVVQTVKTDPFSVASSSFADVTGLTATITPTSATSKILAVFTIQGVGSIGATVAYWRAVRDSTAIGVGDAAGNRVSASGGFDVGANNQAVFGGSVAVLDSPATTSAVTYKVQMRNQGSGTVYCNRTAGDIDSANHGRYASSVTLIEVAA